MKLVKVVDRKVIFKNQILELYVATVDVGPITKQYFVSDYGERVGTLVLRDESVLLVEQYRFLINRLTWEIPGGRVEEAETPEAAARRECLEETGLWCERLQPLFRYHPGVDLLANCTYLFYTEEFEEKGNADGREVRRSIWVSFSKCLEMVFSNQIVDALTITAIMSYKLLHGSPK